MGSRMSRRHLIAGAAATACVLVPAMAAAKSGAPAGHILPIRPRPDLRPAPRAAGIAPIPPRHDAPTGSRRTLALYHAHTRQSLNVTYYKGGHYVPSALRKINHFMRDYQADQVKAIDAELLDVLFELQQRLHVRRPYMVLSAYRSPATNARLRRRRRGVAKKSLHMEGKAVDIRVKGVAAGKVAREAIAMKKGGVGYYRRRGYVHVDVGDVRTWRG